MSAAYVCTHSPPVAPTYVHCYQPQVTSLKDGHRDGDDFFGVGVMFSRAERQGVTPTYSIL